MSIDLQKHAYKNVIAIAALSRTATLLLGYIASLLYTRYDKSTELSDNPSIFKYLLSWDAVHILHIADKGYTYEHSIPFFPLLPMIVRHIPLSDNLTKAVVLNTLLFVVSAALLYKITLQKYSSSIAFLSTIFFIFNPASVIYSTFYTESLFCLLFLMAFYHIRKGNMLRAATFVGLCSLTRSNTVMLLIFFRALYFPIIIIPLAILQLWYLLLLIRLHCSFRIFVPYSYVQDVYWEQGFLKFMQPRNIPNMLFGLAPICHSLYILRLYADANLLQFFAGLYKRSAEKSVLYRSLAAPETYNTRIAIRVWWGIQNEKLSKIRRALSLNMIWEFMKDPFCIDSTSDSTKLAIILASQIAILIFFIHWNIAYRFISFNPFLYWSLSFLALRHYKSYLFRAVVAFHFSFGMLYTVLFSCFYPPA